MEILKLLKRACPRACPLRAFYYAPSGKPLCLTEWQSLEGWVGKLRWLGCGLHRLRMRVQSPVGAHTSARECISKWNNQSMFLTLPPHPSLGGGTWLSTWAPRHGRPGHGLGPPATLLTGAALLRLPVDADALALAGPGVRQERLAVAVFVDRTLAHVCHAGPREATEKEQTFTNIQHPECDLQRGLSGWWGRPDWPPEAGL